jgi:hypothetical protein
MKHENNCECYRCKYGDAAFKKKMEEGMEQYGFNIHYVPNDCNCPHHTNIHTHGIKESFNHLDFQICFPIPMELAGEILHGLVNDIKDGKKFEANKEYEGVIGNGYSVKMIEATECGRDVLRIILPDPSGLYNIGPYADQLKMTDHR